MPVSSKFHVASRILLHSSWNMCNQANTLPWSISVLCGKVCVPRRTHDLCTQLQESTRPILHILLSVSLGVSYSVSQTSGRKGCWLIGPRSNDVGRNTPLVIGCDRRACATMFNLQTGHHWGGHHWSFHHWSFYHFRMPKDFRDAKDEDKLLGRRTASFHFSDQPMPLVWSSIVDTLTRVFWTTTLQIWFTHAILVLIVSACTVHFCCIYCGSGWPKQKPISFCLSQTPRSKNWHSPDV